MLAYMLRLDVGNGVPSPLFSACGPCGGGGCLDKAYLGRFVPRAQPYYVGDTWSLRFKVEHPMTGAAIDLTNKIIIATFKKYPTDPVGIVRRSDVVIVGSAPPQNQIQKDSQTIDNGISGTTGRGWFALYFGSQLTEICQMLSVIGNTYFTLQLEDTVTGDVTTILTWCFAVYQGEVQFP